MKTGKHGFQGRSMWRTGALCCLLVLSLHTEKVWGAQEEPVVIEYQNLEAMVTEGNLTLQQDIGDYEDNIEAYKDIWDTLKWEQDNMEDRAENGDYDAQALALYSSNAAMLKSSASRIYSQLETLTEEKSLKSLKKSVDSYTLSAKTLMNSCSQMASSIEAREKSVEALEASYQAILRQQTAGAATQAQAEEAKKSLDQAQNQLLSLQQQKEDSILKLKDMLGLQGKEVILGSMPLPDLEAISAVDLEADKQRAIGNDQNVQNERHQKAVSTTEINNRFKRVEEAEGTAEANITATYQTMLVEMEQYKAAEESYESALLVYQSLQRRKQAGLLSNTEYLEGQAQYYQAKSSRDIAAMELLAAYEGYQWEVLGISG